jgi:hypothetical protein
MAFILPTPDWKFECLCGAVYDYYTCRCVSWCKEINYISAKWQLIKH